MHLHSKREKLLILISDFRWKNVCVLSRSIVCKASMPNVSTKTERYAITFFNLGD